MRRIPIFATLVVLVAVGIMIALGFWQMRRLAEKEALLARYAAAGANAEEVVWSGEGPGEDLLYRRASLDCEAARNYSSIAGRNARDEAGFAQTAQCTLPGGATATVVLGWARQPNAASQWEGGKVRGVIAPGPRLVADPPLAGLEANATPDPSSIPNNHFSYAMQWFFFAVTALVIYAIAVMKRGRR